MSLKRISQEIGVSMATVSRVLNHPEYECQKSGLAERIRECARTMNYVPDSNARQLKLGAQGEKSRTYAVDFFLARFDTLEADPFFYEMFRYIETELLKQNCYVGDIINMPNSDAGTELRKNETKGLIILGKCPAAVLSKMKKGYYGIVAVDRNPMDYEVDEVVCNGFHAAVMAVEYLIQLGHHKIGYVGDCNMESRYMGYYECLMQHKIPLTYDYIVSTSQTKEEGYRAFMAMQQKTVRPTAVLCGNDVTAIGFLKAMKEVNGRKKKNIYQPSVISIDDIGEASESKPMLTTVHIPKEDMAHLAVMILHDRLECGHRESIRLELPCSLKIRESCERCF